ncbi:hypothetical protein H7J87_18265 [Mycolicibacterium wolinskyi]|uniref:hypothetical protein n=1 Tax=Mycolicibacterium wolinskyi TaxID=59750 RepID=UPI0021F39685|nr:hypothetical protein [Mycolicibacterium wolinskyi]MCV7287270.1 hypothetical protein [Mycolicibacterium wolinskyi]
MAAKNEEDWEAELYGKAEAPFNEVLAGLFAGLPAGMPQPIAILWVLVKRFTGVELPWSGNNENDFLESLQQWAESIPELAAAAVQALRDRLTGIVNSTPTDLDDWLLSLLTGESYIDAGKLVNLEDIGQIAQEKITGLLDALNDAVDDAQQAVRDALTGIVNATPTDLDNWLLDLLTGESPLNADNITSGIIGKPRLPTLDRIDIPDLQGIIDAGINALNNTPGVVGQAANLFEDFLSRLPTKIFNHLGGHSAARASEEEAAAALETVASTINAQGQAITALQAIIDSGEGFSELVSFRTPETTTYSTAGGFTYSLPSWFTLGTDFIDRVMRGGGGGADGAGVGATDGQNGQQSTLTINGVTHTAPGGTGSITSDSAGDGAPAINYLDVVYPGSADQNTNGQPGNAPAGGGAAAVGFGRQGGLPGGSNTGSVSPTSPTITGSVGSGGNGGTGFGGAGGAGAPGRISLVARPAMPLEFTDMGLFSTTAVRLLKLNTGAAFTDEMTAAATWSRVPGGPSINKGNMLVIRANAAFTSFVFLMLESGSGTTSYNIGRMSAGSRADWKTNTITEAIPFNAFSLVSDDDYTFTVAVNGTPIDSYVDAAHSSLKGADYRHGGWGTSDSVLPGSISQFIFLDSGTPSRITSDTINVAEARSTTTYGDLLTPGPSVTLNVPESGEVLIDLSANVGDTGATGRMGFRVSGANTMAPSDDNSVFSKGYTTSRRFHLTDLNPGTTTFKVEYRAVSATPSFTNRTIIVDPKP